MTSRYVFRLSALLLMLCVLASVMGCSTSSLPAGGDVLGLMYHNLSENPADVSAWTTTPDALRANLTELTQLGYYPLSLEAYIAGDYEPTRNYFVLTFDDGYESNLTLALPILKELFIPASIFVVTDLVGQPDYMNWEQVQAAAESGIFTIYSHTHTHMNAQEHTTEEFLADVQTSAEELTTHLGESVHRVLCYPYGAATPETAHGLKDAGYEMIVLQQLPEWYSEEEAPRLLLRVNIHGGESDMTALVRQHRRRMGFAPIQTNT